MKIFLTVGYWLDNLYTFQTDPSFFPDTRIIICSDELISSTFYKMATALINLSRLYPVATENARMLQEDIVIQGYRIPPNVSQYHCYKEYN